MLRNTILVVLGLAVVANLIILSTGSLTPREVGLLSTILAVLSVAVSWVVAHIYSESSHQKAIQEVKEFHQSSLKTYALNAAEKTNNISIQLNRLSMYLQEKLSDDSYESVNERLSASEERIASAVHILQTLKSVNDTGLSDWKGIIGEELAEQQETQEERAEEIRTIIEKVANLESTSSIARTGNQVVHIDRDLRAEMVEIKKEIRSLVSGLTGTNVAPPGRRTKKTVQPCPNCKHQFEYTQYCFLYSAGHLLRAYMQPPHHIGLSHSPVQQISTYSRILFFDFWECLPCH